MKDRAALREYHAAWVKAHPERVRQYHRRYWVKHGYGAQYRFYQRNRDHYRAYYKVWKRSNLIKLREYSMRRYARESGPAVDYQSILDIHGMICHICGKPIESQAELHFDHVHPLCRGGAHCALNLLPAHAFCNYSKHHKLMSELCPK